jgi:hypothetical protein
VEKIVEGFFDGSPEALAAHLSTREGAAREVQTPSPAAVDAPATPVAELQTQDLDERLL